MHGEKSSRALIPNPNVDEFLRQEGMTEDEYKRIYDLRYCTILVPFDESDEENLGQDRKSVTSKDNSHETPNNDSVPWTPPRRRGDKQPGTPTSAQSQKPEVFPVLTTSHGGNHTPIRPIGLLTPTENRQKSPLQNISDTSQVLNNDEDQEEDFNESNKGVLTTSDPLSSYLTTARHNGLHLTDIACGRSAALTTASIEDGGEGIADSEMFHDALELYDENEEVSFSEHQDRHGGPSKAGIKRRRWELESSPKLLQQRQPSTTKRVALAISSSIDTTSTTFTPTTLLKPRSFTPTLIPPLLQRRGSNASDASSASGVGHTQGSLWTTQDWKALEEVYNDMNASSMVEADLGQVADRFLAEQESKTGETPSWSREKVLFRCVALHRVRNNTHKKPNHNLFDWEPTPFSHTRGANRRLVQPYPLRRTQRSETPQRGADGASSSAISDFLSHQRADRSNRHRAEEQGYQLKSVFKHRLASGLRTVGQLIPFWKDVEQGNVDIKEKVKVPLVPVGKALAVIETFESKKQTSEATQPYSRPGSAMSHRSDSTCESVAGMLARGHSERSHSASK
ncbi:hypothetical protein BX616_003016 [Lobosporangium transversale]|uniref:Uncharacterized protein n=1 Tax=Lobosporangium transversale TaxID=64571 RepID=A0A1Y2H265_9FUNG|nr:hypothetical protein BCR41DRAFT_417780 [Lobosporangium transversale]KAF9899472.1 hypothetical protein BX616_003016 [Lobosporangium transversale]ORZ28638.1 hypothetical protein BCR41DRAFT_417780 [Lobosporangium transversale]|eukprot:XP_021886311.1 hypothetical protein BCR41DRAFT_417780 [Lobosporangium transversale]